MQVKHQLAACVAGAVGLAFTAGAFAQTNVPQDKRVYVAPMVSYGFFDKDTLTGDKSYGGENSFGVKNDDSIGVSLAVGKPINKWLNLEVFGYYFNPKQKLNGHNAHHADMYGFGLDGLFFPARDTLPVYGILGASWGQVDPGYRSINGTDTEGSNADMHALDAGVGYMYTLNDYGLKVRAEYRYRYASIDMGDVLGSGYNNEHHNDHILSLGLQIPLGAPPTAPVAQEPAPAPAPAPAPVEEPAPVRLEGVNFKFDSAQLTAQATHRLNNVVDALDASPNIDFRIDGYTDSTGPAAYNMKLSDRRANSVRSYLVDHGIETNRITAVQGHGENDPVATNATREGRAQNRRVELTPTNQD